MVLAEVEGPTGMNELAQEQSIGAGYVLQQFKMIRSLGAGFHGEVWLAEHLHTGVPFAFKFMHLEDSRDAKKVRRALETAKGTYRIDHANVIKVHDLGCEASGMVWLRMDYLEGKSVGELLRHGALSLLVAIDIAIEVAWGLQAAHELGIIHRDIKPDNVFMTRDGVIVVLDFSIAKVISAGLRTTARKTGMGTAPYMGPEHLKGAHPDARFDVYALGIMLWEMIVGRHPFSDVLGDPEALIRRQLRINPEPLSVVAHVPVEVDEVIRRATAKDPAARFGSAVEMAQALTRLKASLLAEVAASRLVLAKRRGELTVNSPRGRKDYRRNAAPDATPAPPVPSQRVVVAASSLPQTLPLPDPTGPGGTLPFGANILDIVEQQRAEAASRVRDTARLSPAPSPMPFGMTPTPMPMPPTPPRRAAPERRTSEAVPIRRKIPVWVPLVFLAMIVGGIVGGLMLRAWARRPRPTTAAGAPSDASGAAAPLPSPHVPDAPPSAEASPSAAPSADGPPPVAPEPRAPPGSTAPPVAPPHPKVGGPRARTPSAAPTFQPLFQFGK